MHYIYIMHVLIVFCFFGGIKLLLGGTVHLRRLSKLRSGRFAAIAGEKSVRCFESFGPFKSIREERVDKEIYEAMTFIGNFTAATGGNVGSQFILEQLSYRESVLKEAYIKALGFVRLNKLKDAENEILQKADTEAGHALAALMLNWDRMKPDELTEILETRRKSIREIYITRRKRREELLSDIIYLPVVANVFLIFINFIYVGYFMQQKELLNMIF